MPDRNNVNGDEDSLGVLHSLQTRMIVSFCLLFVGILSAIQLSSIFGIPFTSYEGRVGMRKALSAKKLDLIAETKADRLQQWFQARRADSQIIAHNELVEENVARLRGSLRRLRESGVQNGDLWQSVRVSKGYAYLQRYLQSVLQARGDYEAILVADGASGTVIFSTDPSLLGEDISASAEFAGALRSKDAYVTDPRGGAGREEPCSELCFSHAIRPAGGETAGVAILRVAIDRSIPQMLHTGDGLGQTGEALLVDRNATIIAPLRHPLPDGSRATPLEYRIHSEPAERAARGETGFVEAWDYRGTLVMAAFRFLPLTPEWGWGMVVKVDKTELFAPMREDLFFSTLLAMFGMLVIVVSTIAMGANLTLPILSLARTAKRLAEGDLSIRCGLKRKDEIGLLSESFDAMADTIQESMSGLEQRGLELQQTAEALEAWEQIQEKALDVSRTLASTSSLDELLEQGLAKLMEITRSQVGAIYLPEDKGSEILRLSASLGIAAGTEILPEIGKGHGPGLAAAGKTIEVLREIPAETRFTVKTVAGESLPNCIVNAPLVLQERVVGMVSMASLYPIPPEQLEVLDMTRAQLATAIVNALGHSETERLAADLRRKNEELAAMNEELHAQSEELQAQSEELKAQSEELRSQTGELMEQQTRAEEADRLKSEFLSNMSHELRTPLNSVLALSQLMLGRGIGEDPEQEAEFLRVIERNGRHLLSLINDILDLSKIEAGRMELLPIEFDPAQTVLEAAETIRPLCAAKGLELKTRVEGLPPMQSDPEKVRQILLNLLSNAAKFTDQGEVEVAARDLGASVCFTVRDTGVGISRADQANIFDEFRQVDGSTTRRHEGTGLGLAISRKLSRLLGGDLAVESEPGKGTVFTVTLPRSAPGSGGEDGMASRRRKPESPSQEESTAAPIRGKTQLQPSRRKKPLVLVVEDNPVAVLQIRSALEAGGYDVQVASGGEEGLASVRSTLPDMIVLDLMMPGVDGFEVLERLRSEPATENLPVLVLTAKELSGAERARLNHNRVQQLIQKGSLDRSQLMANIERLLRDRARKTKSEQRDPAPEGSRKGGGTILVVEDNPDNRVTLEAMLAEMGLSCTVAADGVAALEAIGKERPSLVLMDVHLPLLNGLDATRRIKSDPALKSIPVVALTARAMEGDRESCLAAGCDDYLSKPLDRKALEKVVNRWMETS